VGRQNSSVRDTFTTRGSTRFGVVTQTGGGVIQLVLEGIAAATTTSATVGLSLLGGLDVGLVQLGALFSQYRFKRMRYTFHTAAGQQNGSFVMALSDDADDATNSGTFSITAANLTIFRCKRHISVWKDGSMNWRPKDAQQWYYTSGGDASVTDADVRMSRQVVFYFASDGGGAAVVDGNMGSIDLDYEIEFRGRRPAYGSLTVSRPKLLHPVVEEKDDDTSSSSSCVSISQADYDYFRRITSGKAVVAAVK